MRDTFQLDPALEQLDSTFYLLNAGLDANALEYYGQMPRHALDLIFTTFGLETLVDKPDAPSAIRAALDRQLAIWREQNGRSEIVYPICPYCMASPPRGSPVPDPLKWLASHKRDAHLICTVCQHKGTQRRFTTMDKHFNHVIQNHPDCVLKWVAAVLTDDLWADVVLLQ